jgi:transposase
LDLDSIEVLEQTVIVHLHATTPSAACPQCGTAGSRVHSRYSRTIADVAFGGRNLELQLLVRKWICPEASCSRHIFAERFPELVQRYARMTNRLIKALQSVGVISNGADAALIASSLGVPTTAKTIIRRVLQLPLPSEGSVRKVGIDEWAWKKGQRYGTILVDLEKRRVVQLLAERSVETSKAWLRKHPEIDLVSRDRGKLFREATTDSAPQAKQVVDRFHATRRTSPKPWRTSFANRSVCSKRRGEAAQERHILWPGRRCLRKSHTSVVLVIANTCAFINGFGSSIERDTIKSRLLNSSG